MYKVFINHKELIIANDKPSDTSKVSLITNVKDKKHLIEKIDNFLNNIDCQDKILYISDDDPCKIWSYLKDYSIYLEAAGGLVLNPLGQLLFIYRYGKWDLPKGKIEPGEDEDLSAKREVVEECGIDGLEIIKPLPSTYHMYFLPSDQWVLKKTFWYLMRSEIWQDPVPQLEEDITRVEWVNPQDVNEYLKKTYPSIRTLVNNFLIDYEV